jgi:WD40 repeat protein/beta-lactamase regulating signal transducer with metallopeptidase domain
MREILNLCIELLNRAGDVSWNFAGAMFVQTAALVLVLLAVDLLVRRRARAIVRYWLWLLVLFKLVLPVDLRTPASVAYWLPSGEATHSRFVEHDVVAGIIRPPEIHGPTLEADPNISVSNSIPAAAVATHIRDARQSNVPAQPTQIATVPDPVAPLHWHGALLTLWILAVVILLAMVGRRALWVRRITRQATDAPRELEDLLRSCISQMGMKGRKVGLRITDHLGSPAICGLWRPIVLLPRQFPAGLEREQIRMVFVHELVHCRRGDLQVNCCQTLLQILYFYNPAIWFANLMIRRLREQAVDETVLVVLRGQCEQYASTLLDIAGAALQPAEAMLQLVGVVESRRALAMRISHILHRPVPRTAKLGFTGLATIAAVGLLMLPMGHSERSVVAQDEPANKATDPHDKRASGEHDAAKDASVTAASGQDIDGDPLPAGVIARLGSKRFRPGSRPIALSYLADGKTLAQITDGGRLQHWDPVSGRLLSELQFAKGESPSAVAAHNNNLVATGGFGVDGDPFGLLNSLWVFDLSSGARTMEMTIDDRSIGHLALSPDGRTLAFGGNKLHLIDVAKQSEIASREFDRREIQSLAFSRDGQMLAIGGQGAVMLWNWGGKEEPRSIAIPHNPRKSPHGVDAITFSPDGATLAVINGNTDFEGIMLIDAARGEIVRSFNVPSGEDWGSRSLAFSPDGKLLVNSISDMRAGGGVALWDVATGKLLRRLRGLFGEAYYFAFSPDGRQLAASSYWDSTMCVWNLETGKRLGSELPGHFKPPNSIRFLPGDRQLATAGDDGTVRVWNLASSRQEQVMRHGPDERGRTQMLRGMDVSPDGKYVVSSSLDDTVRLWETATGREIYRLPGHGDVGGHRAVRFTPDGKQFASWGDDMDVYLWDVGMGKAVQAFVARPAGLKAGQNAEGRHPPFTGPDSSTQLSAARFSADASFLILALDGVRRFSVPTGEELPKIECPPGRASRIALSFDNRYLLWTDFGPYEQVRLPDGSSRQKPPKNHPVELRSLADGKTITRIEPAGRWANAVAFSPDGSRVAMAVIDDPPRITLNSVPDLTEVGRIELPSRTDAIEFSHSGKLLAASFTDSTVLVWDLEQLPRPK